MKKVGIITHYDVHNHGAHLQLYALVKCLAKLGYEAKALRFQKNYDFMGGAEAGKKYNVRIEFYDNEYNAILRMQALMIK